MAWCTKKTNGDKALKVCFKALNSVFEMLIKPC